MKLEKWALIAEIVGGIAIVISLIIVAIQVQQNTRAQDAATYQEVFRDLRAVLDRAPSGFRAARARGEEPSGEQIGEYYSWLTGTLRTYENWWQQHAMGTLSDELFESYITHMRATFRDSTAHEYWNDDPNDPATPRTVEYLPGFVDFVDRFLIEQRSYDPTPALQ